MTFWGMFSHSLNPLPQQVGENIRKEVACPLRGHLRGKKGGWGGGVLVHCGSAGRNAPLK